MQCHVYVCTFKRFFSLGNRGLFRVFLWCCQGVTRCCQGVTRRVFLWCCQGVTRRCQGVTRRVFLWCCQGVTRSLFRDLCNTSLYSTHMSICYHVRLSILRGTYECRRYRCTFFSWQHYMTRTYEYRRYRCTFFTWQHYMTRTCECGVLYRFPVRDTLKGVLRTCHVKPWMPIFAWALETRKPNDPYSLYKRSLYPFEKSPRNMDRCTW